MKKVSLILVFVLCAALCLAACGKTQTAPETTPAPAVEATEAPVLAPVLPGSNLSSGETEQSGESEETASFDEEAFNTAMSCIDLSVDELYLMIGKPSSSSYAPSCLNLGNDEAGEDGELYYEGFYVATYRVGENEVVRDVIRNAG